MKTEPGIEAKETFNRQHSHRRRSWLATIGALFVVLLIVGISALAYAQIAPRHHGQGGQPIISGSWEKALSGYLVTELDAAPGNPTILYACAQRNQGNGVVSSVNQTVLRSTDSGLHWQDIGGKAGTITGCQLAVNPNNSNDVYLATMNVNGQQTRGILKHTTDGGQTWTTIQPALSIPGANAIPVWSVTRLSIVGQHLFGIQTLSINAPLEGRKGTIPRYAVYNLPRLVTSSDGGLTWTVLDQQFAATHQGAGDYAVDPANLNTIYDLVSIPWLPIQPLVAEPNGNLPAFGSNASLYKTTNGGATWQLALTNLPFGSMVQLAANRPQIVYVGGIRRPMPLVGAMLGASPTNMVGNFHLHVSVDGGANWRDVPALPTTLYPQTWLVNENGQVYVYAVRLNIRPTVGIGTAIAGTAVTIPKVTPQSSQPGQPHEMPMIRQPALAPTTIATATPAQIERFDPATNGWHMVIQSPGSGNLLAVTSGNGATDLLWFMSSSGHQPVLYRAVVS